MYYGGGGGGGGGGVELKLVKKDVSERYNMPTHRPAETWESANLPSPYTVT